MAAPRTLPQYDYMRQQAEQQNTAQSQQEEEALKRRLATAGALNTGAGIKQQNLQGENAIQRKEQTMQGIGFQEAAAQQALDEAQKGREFQTSERVGSQDFSAGQTKAAQAYGTSERLGGQEFVAGQTKLGQDYAAGESTKAQNFAAGESTKAQNFTAGESAIDRKAKLDAETAAAEKSASEFKITSDLAKQAEAAKERIDNATWLLQMTKPTST